jgi:hypothetical protein
LFSKHDDVGINAEPDDSSSSAIPADAVNGLDEIAERQYPLLVIGFHSTTISRNALRVLWGVHPWGVDPTGDLRNPHAVRAKTQELVMGIGWGEHPIAMGKCPGLLSAYENQTQAGVGVGGFFHEGTVRMNKANGRVDQIKMGLEIVLLATLMGCVGYVGGGYGGAVVVADPDVYVFGGGSYGGGHDIHAYSQRGAASRAVAHPVGHR